MKPTIKAKYWLTEAQQKIEQVLNPYILKDFNKKNMRSLSSEEQSKSELIKFGTLASLPIYSSFK